MTPGGGVEIRILSGPHVGASLELTPGRYVLGRGEECDLVLADDSVAERHLTLAVKVGPSGPEMRGRPLDGQVFLNGHPLGAEKSSPIPPGAVLVLGFTALAWQPPGEAWMPVNLVPADFRHPGEKDGLPAGEPASAPPRNEAERAGSEPLPNAAPAFFANEGDKASTPEAQAHSRRWRRQSLIAAVAVAAILSGLALGPQIELLLTSRTTEQTLLEAILLERGFGQLTVENDAYGLKLTGVLYDDRELSRLVRLVTDQPARVYLAVEVEDDLVRAVRDLMLARGFFPAVRRVEGRMSVAVYCRDGLVEARLHDLLKGDLPGLGQPSWRVVYAPEVKAVLEEELSRVGLSNLKLHFGPGRVEWSGALDLSARQRLDLAQAAAEKRLKTPLSLRPTGSAPAEEDPALAAAIPNASVVVTLPSLSGTLSAPAPTTLLAEEDPLGGLKIMSVTMGPLCFFTVQDGRKYFEGGVLPSGYTVTAVSAREIKLSRDGRVVNHQLAGDGSAGN